MTTDIIEINNFVVLIEQSNEAKPVMARCDLDDQVIGILFYGSGNVVLDISYNNKTTTLNNSTGVVTSFYGNKKVEFIHNISHTKPLYSVSIFSTLDNINKLSQQEREIFTEHLAPLLKAEEDFVQGPQFYMTPEMQRAISKVFETNYTGPLRKMFLQSQVTELLAHFFAFVTSGKKTEIKELEKEKLYDAREIIISNMAKPPSLNELSKMIGLNSNKLKKNFKELFGIPVFKYLQSERLLKAHELLKSGEMNIQETAWHVGYESISSFSNAFTKMFGYRPSEVAK
ncbi:MAG: helix-turn-helix transcriptional regulator [Cyclobacteriaceae bacterium]|nr:helix-turn-helix transcriptional regulator [Cyclobacteriaceae bacterium]